MLRLLESCDGKTGPTVKELQLRGMPDFFVSAVWALLVAVSACHGGSALERGARDGMDRTVDKLTLEYSHDSTLPLVVNTWTGDFSHATERAWAVVSLGKTYFSALDAVEEVV